MADLAPVVDPEVVHTSGTSEAYTAGEQAEEGGKPAGAAKDDVSFPFQPTRRE